MLNQQRTAHQHLGPIEHGVGRVLQCCYTATQILNVVEVILDRLADDVGPTAAELGSRRIKLSPDCIRQNSSDITLEVKRRRGKQQRNSDVLCI